VLSLATDDAIDGIDLPIASENNVVSTFELFGKHFFHSSHAMTKFFIHRGYLLHQLGNFLISNLEESAHFNEAGVVVFKPRVKRLLLILNCSILGFKLHFMLLKALPVFFDNLLDLAEQLEIKPSLFKSGANIRR